MIVAIRFVRNPRVLILSLLSYFTIVSRRKRLWCDLRVFSLRRVNFPRNGLKKQLSKWRPETETSSWRSNTTEWPLDNLNITVSCNNNSWTAYLAVNFYTIYLIFTYHSIIMLTWTRWSERSSTWSCHTHITGTHTIKKYPASHPSIINHRSFFHFFDDP